MGWLQREVQIPAKKQGCHLITDEILSSLPELSEISIGLLHVFIKHTSASLTINENADPDVRHDLAMSLNRIAPESFPYRHTLEGADDMPAHVKSTLTQTSLQIPIVKGRLGLGTWQGIYLLEHRYHGGRRELLLTVQY